MKKIRRFLFIIIIILIGVLSYDVGYKEVYIPIQESKDPLSILFVGADISDQRDAMYGGTKDPFTDALMVITFNPNTYVFETTSIPRDTAVDYVCTGNEILPKHRAQINHVYAASGESIDCVIETVENFLNVPINYYVKVNMDQVVTLVDKVGPLEIKAHAADGFISQTSMDIGNDGAVYTWQNGETYQMSGQEAVMYARARKDSEKDYGRGIRQQQVVAQLMANIFETGFDLELIDSLLQLVDTNMPYVLVYKYYEYAQEINNQTVSILQSESETPITALPETTWKNIFKYFNFNQDEVNQQNINEFKKYVSENSLDISSYFVRSHQFFNQKYDNFFNVVPEQLELISSSLQSNLELEIKPPSIPSLPYGDNTGYVNMGIYQGE